MHSLYIVGMAGTGDLTIAMWMALRELQRVGESDLHHRTAQALIDRQLARKKGVARNGRWVCEITPKGRKYGTSQSRGPRWYPHS
jgi:hypothetical protein